MGVLADPTPPPSSTQVDRMFHLQDTCKYYSYVIEKIIKIPSHVRGTPNEDTYLSADKAQSGEELYNAKQSRKIL